MGQEFSYDEYMGELDIPDSLDGLDESRILFEKKMKFLILLDKFGTFGFCGSSEYKELGEIKITRTDIKNYLESFDIKNHMNWINEVLPNKLVNIVKKSDYIDLDLEKKIKEDVEYKNKINPKKCDLVKEIYSNLNGNDKIDICKRIFDKYSKYIKDKEIFEIFICKYGPKDNNDDEIKKFFVNFDKFDKYKVTNKNFLVMLIDEKIKNSEPRTLFNFFNNITWKKRFEFLKNNPDFYSELSSYENGIRDKILDAFKPDEKILDAFKPDEIIKFVDNYFNNLTPDMGRELANDYKFNKIFKEKIIKNENYKKFEFEVKYDLLKKKYFNELDKEKKEKLTEYKLDYNSHYELFKLDEKKFMKILLYHDQIDDFTFNHWDFDNWDFLNKFNEEVKTYLKNKIYADSNFIVEKKEKNKNKDDDEDKDKDKDEDKDKDKDKDKDEDKDKDKDKDKDEDKDKDKDKDEDEDDEDDDKYECRHRQITTLDNYINIMYFIHNPPVFLRMTDTKYYPEYINLMDKYARDFGFDFDKINYLNMIARVVFDFV